MFYSLILLLLSLLLFFKSPLLASYMSKYGWFCMKWNFDATPAFKARFCLNRKTSPTKNIFDKKYSLN